MPELFWIESVREGHSRSRNTRSEIAEVRFHPFEEMARPDIALELLIGHLFARVIGNRPPPLKISLQLHPPTFDRPFTIPLRSPEQNNPAAIAAAIERLNDESDAQIDLAAGTTQTKVVAVWPLGVDRAAEDDRQGLLLFSFGFTHFLLLGACDEHAEHRITAHCQSLVPVHNPNDRLCLARAVLIGLAHRRSQLPGGGGANAFAAYAQQQQRQGPEARNLLRRAGISRRQHMYTLEDVERLQQWANGHFGNGEVRLVVFEKERQYRVIYKGLVPAAK
jgi:hypothetical protein